MRRIYREYLAGRSPKAIVTDLNREGIPSPRGGKWNASTLNGNRKRANGILSNSLDLQVFRELSMLLGNKPSTEDELPDCISGCGGRI